MMNDLIKPEARKKGIVTQEMSDELLVFDLDANKAHCLNSTAGFVWKNCDGKNTADDIRRELERTTGGKIAAEIVMLAIEQLRSTNLLEPAESFPESGISRRQLLRKAGLAAAVALPLVSSLAVPTSVLASASGLPSGSPCTSPVDCASGVCIPGAPPYCV